MERPTRKPNRLPEYDYSQNGAYFVTICTADKKSLFWDTVGAAISRPRGTNPTAGNQIGRIRRIPDMAPFNQVIKSGGRLSVPAAMSRFGKWCTERNRSIFVGASGGVLSCLRTRKYPKKSA